MPKTLILSDIHEDLNYIKEAESRAVDADEVVCLGDYWDSWNGVTDDTHKITNWVLKKLSDPKYTLLWGNHDLHYAYAIRAFRCSGYSSLRQSIIDPKFKQKDWSKLCFHTWVHGWLLTHAGIVPKRAKVPPGEHFSNWMTKQEIEIREALHQGVPHAWLEAGYSRGGSIHAASGGLVWADWSEMGVLPGVDQLCGHSEDSKIRRIEKDGNHSICMDTRRKHLGWIDETGKLTFEQL